jgi:nucleoside 2-deoxyribosyltransferase
LRRALRRHRAYLAAPLFTPAERAFNLQIDAVLSRHFEVFLPQRDGHLIPGSRLNQQSFNRVARRVFAGDIEAITSADVVLAVLDGRTIDEGVAFELGVAFALKKICVGFRSDSRVLLPWGINPMIEGALSNSVSSLTDLRQWVESTRRRMSERS